MEVLTKIFEILSADRVLTAKYNKSHEKYHDKNLVELPITTLFWCIFSGSVIIVFGFIEDFLQYLGIDTNNTYPKEWNRSGYVPLYNSFESFFTRNIYIRIRDCWNVPICSVPGTVTKIIDRNCNDKARDQQLTGENIEVVNMVSYNYLGFAQNCGEITDRVEKTIIDNGLGLCTTRHELGTTDTIAKLEELTARYVGVEDSIVFGMGFATNSTNIPTLANKGCLILSDELNHSSLILGCRQSGATIRVFRHNDMQDLERKVRDSIVSGQPRTGRQWRKIIIVCEGIYSMEGNIVDLPELIRIKKRYKCYVYLDEAHSIGAIGPNGRGVCDHFGCDPNDIDLLMGTFTKSFGAAGGYICGKKCLIDHIRVHSYSALYANAMSPVIAQQISEAMTLLSGSTDGQNRIERLARNTHYFRLRLKQMGFIIYGSDDSPIVPLLLIIGIKIPAVVRMARTEGIGLIGVCFPATSLTTSRIRFCISAAHTKQMLDKCLEVMDRIGDEVEIKYKVPDTCPPIVY